MAIVAVTAPIATFLMLDAAQGPRQFAVLYAGLTEPEAAVVQFALTSRSVPFELHDGGHTILAPVAKCAELRVEFDQRVLPWARTVLHINEPSNGDTEALRGASVTELQRRIMTAQDYYKQGAAG